MSFSIEGWGRRLCGKQDCGDDGSATDTFGDGEDCIDAGGAFLHDVQPVVVLAGTDGTDAVVLDTKLCKGWFDATRDPHVLALRVLAGVGHGLLADAEELGLHIEAQPSRT